MGKLVTAVGLVLLSLTPAWCDKVTRDPNAPGAAKPAAAKQEADPRLDRKLTYLGGYKRLSAVAEDLTRLTGVTVRAGSSAKNWQVRDIPVVVCSQDLPLGKLLNAIADATHNRFVREDKEAGEKPIYRIVRDKIVQDRIDGIDQERERQVSERAKWAWDTLAQFATAPEKLKLQPGVPDAAERESGLRLTAKAIGALGTAVRDKAVAGEQVLVRTKDSPDPAAFAELFRYACKQFALLHKDSPGWGAIEPTQADIGDSALFIKLARDYPWPGECEFNVQ